VPYALASTSLRTQLASPFALNRSVLPGCQASNLLDTEIQTKSGLTRCKQSTGPRPTRHKIGDSRRARLALQTAPILRRNPFRLSRGTPNLGQALVPWDSVEYPSELTVARKTSANLPRTTDRRIDALLTLLAENATIVVSGAKIAKEIGVSRQQVWRWIQELRTLGVRVKGHPRTGYHIEQMPDILVPQMLSHRLYGTPFARRIYHFFKLDSTNTVAMRLAEQGEPHGTVVLAEEQTGGRGRAGRSWISEKSSGIYCTILLRPSIPPAYAPLLTLVAGLAARDAAAEDLDTVPDIRWPNDLLVGGRKFAGILTEMHAEPDRVHYAVVGVGMNVNQTKLPPPLAGIATSLKMETRKTHSRFELLVRLLRHFDRYYNQFLSEGAPSIVRRFAEVSSFAQGKRVRITTATETFTGTTAGLEPSGVLRVSRDDGRGIEPVLSGDVAEADGCS
jgi:BirA family transcriptional regulator, biotin operon repressor / biotin---[acetyl-CoA-carboxylase] ligase